MSRELYIGTNGLFFKEGEKVSPLHPTVQTRMQIIDGGSVLEWRNVCHCISPPRQGVVLFWECNSVRQPLGQTLAPDTDRRWVNSQWATWREHFGEFCGVTDAVVDACFMKSNYSEDEKSKQTKSVPIPVASDPTVLTSLSEYSTNTTATIYLFMKWAKHLPDANVKKNALTSLNRFVRERTEA